MNTLYNKLCFLSNKLHLNSAIIWSLIGYAVSALSTPVIAFFIATHFSPELQGYYYTFLSLLALSVFLELGFGTCIIQIASHEFAHLNWSKSGKLEGVSLHLHRFISLARLSFKWYTIGAIFLFIGVGTAGELFFQKHDLEHIHWRGGWWLLCAATAGGFPLIAITSLLTGCNEIAWTARARIYQNLAKAIVLLIALLLGCELYSPGLSAITGILVLFFLNYHRWKGFFQQIFQKMSMSNTISWKQEIWPFQWRIALSWASGYLIFSVFNPIIFEFDGAVVAGQFGITWTLIQACHAIAQVFTSTRQPTFGILIARQDWQSLKRVWFLSMSQTVIIFLLLSVILIAGLHGLKIIRPELSNRFLSWNSFLPFLIATLFNQGFFSIATLARAEKKEPFLFPSICTGILVLLGSVLFGYMYGVNGIAWSYCVITIMIFPWSIIILYKTSGFTQKNHSYYPSSI